MQTKGRIMMTLQTLTRNKIFSDPELVHYAYRGLPMRAGGKLVLCTFEEAICEHVDACFNIKDVSDAIDAVVKFSTENDVVIMAAKRWMELIVSEIVEFIEKSIDDPFSISKNMVEEHNRAVELMEFLTYLPGKFCIDAALDFKKSTCIHSDVNYTLGTERFQKLNGNIDRDEETWYVFFTLRNVEYKKSIQDVYHSILTLMYAEKYENEWVDKYISVMGDTQHSRLPSYGVDLWCTI